MPGERLFGLGPDAGRLLSHSIHAASPR
jgi:hypothetical protein